MVDMEINFTPDEEKWIHAQVAAGRFRDPSAVVNHFLELFFEREESEKVQNNPGSLMDTLDSQQK